MIRVLSIALLAALSTASAQDIPATTQDGRGVVLHIDGTWVWATGDSVGVTGDSVDGGSEHCNDYVTVKVDRVTGDTTRRGIVAFEGTGMRGVILMKHRGSLIVGLKVGDVCVDADSEVNFLFTDDTRHTSTNRLEFNCEGSSTVFTGGDIGNLELLRLLRTKEIDVIRVNTYESYEDLNFSEQQSADLKSVVLCLMGHP